MTPWEGPLTVIYGATFAFTGRDAYEADVEEAYQFVESEAGAPLTAVGYCVQQVGNPALVTPEQVCPYQPLEGGEVRLRYQYKLAVEQYERRGYLYEEFVVSAKLVWVLIRDSQNRQRWRLLNEFQGLRDAWRSPNNSRMSTLHLPRYTFVSLDRSEREPSPALDIVHYPGQFLAESLHPRSFAITRVNPRIPKFLRWEVQRLLSVGIESIVLQWLLLSSGTIAPVAILGALWRWLIRRKSPAK